MPGKQVPAGGIVAVTGASGFIGSHIVNELLKRGFKVRACVRNKDDQEKTQHLRDLTKSSECKGELTFYSGDLSKEGSYDEAFRGADAVIHSAAVVEIHSVSDPIKQIVKPSVDGTLNVLASLDRCGGSVVRYVHTSSIAAVFSADCLPDTVFNEKDWNEYSTVHNGDAYGFAKTEAEKLVWKRKAEGAPYEVSVICPAVSLGPCLTKAHTKGSPVVVRQFLYGNPQPNYFGTFVDVRDVAKAHVEAMIRPEAAGERFICANTKSSMWVVELAKPTQTLFPDIKVSGVDYPAWKLWMGWALSFIPVYGSKLMSPFACYMLSAVIKYDTTKSQKVLGIQYHDLNDTLRDTVRSMIDTGYVNAKKKAKL